MTPYQGTVALLISLFLLRLNDLLFIPRIGCQITFTAPDIRGSPKT
jgi:hypothetical protein